MQASQPLVVLDFSSEVEHSSRQTLLDKLVPSEVQVLALLPPLGSPAEDPSIIVELRQKFATHQQSLSTSRDALQVGCIFTAAGFKNRHVLVVTQRPSLAPPCPKIKICNFLEAQIPSGIEPSVSPAEEDTKMDPEDERQQASGDPDPSVFYVSVRNRSHLKRLFHMLAKALVQNVPRNVSGLINLCATLCQGYVVKEQKKNKEKLDLDQLTFEFVLRLFLDKIFLNKIVLEGIEKRRFRTIKDFLELDEIQQSPQTQAFIQSRKEQVSAKMSSPPSGAVVENDDIQSLSTSSHFQPNFSGMPEAAPTFAKKEPSAKGETVQNFIFAIGSKIIELFKKMGLAQIKRLPKLRNAVSNVVKNEAIKLSNQYLQKHVDQVTDGVLDIFKSQGYIKVTQGANTVEYKIQYFETLRPLDRKPISLAAPAFNSLSMFQAPSFVPQQQAYIHRQFPNERPTYQDYPPGYGARGKPYNPGFPMASGHPKMHPAPCPPGYYNLQTAPKIEFQDFVVMKLFSEGLRVRTLLSLYSLIENAVKQKKPHIQGKNLITEVFSTLERLQQKDLMYFEKNEKMKPTLKQWEKIKPETWSQNVVIILDKMNYPKAYY